MSIVQRVLSRFGFERRSLKEGGFDRYWSDFLATRSGGAVTPKRAESVSAVYACVAAISETIASLPLVLYRRAPYDDRERATDHPLYRVLHDAPNAQQSALEFREQMQAAVLLRGNAFAEIRFGWDGQVRELVPLHNDRVTVLEHDTGRLGYDVIDGKGRVRRLVQEEVFHLRHRSEDGKVGISPIQAAREVLELALSERDHGVSTFRNGTKLTGVLQTAGNLSDEQLQRLRETWAQRYADPSNAGKTAVLGAGVEFKPVSMTLEDAEWIAARQFSVEEVARLFRVPPTVIGDLRHGNYSNSVEMARQFVTLTLRRHLAMWEQAISRQLLTDAGRRTYYAEHSVEGLLRGDSLNRAQFYERGIADGWLGVDEVRRLENLPARQAA
jgi:HK97 family phage portal protein